MQGAGERMEHSQFVIGENTVGSKLSLYRGTLFVCREITIPKQEEDIFPGHSVGNKLMQTVATVAQKTRSAVYFTQDRFAQERTIYC
jgi:hypothetical protein